MERAIASHINYDSSGRINKHELWNTTSLTYLQTPQLKPPAVLSQTLMISADALVVHQANFAGSGRRV
ncbi:hypothetical protein NIES4075_72630 [Tolypothrix sp. NIES-4075]|uniref:hypothetical protein n=1 Tax=Tolypothrix sp. NIES-4075 TaxID=2005459 RepID=UPI000B5C6D35|nr:hypothetical protein [Tolypothrix sp. NIES-4075]GAX46242.1 hypothetical protein NIES4075_72630 [Tolypothrix sp. NIES-4075]